MRCKWDEAKSRSRFSFHSRSLLSSSLGTFPQENAFEIRTSVFFVVNDYKSSFSLKEGEQENGKEKSENERGKDYEFRAFSRYNITLHSPLPSQTFSISSFLTFIGKVMGQESFLICEVSSIFQKLLSLICQMSFYS